MAELSALGVKITSDGVVKTTGELERFVKAATAAGKAAKPINVKVGVAGVSKAAADIQKMDAAMKSMGGGSASAAIKSTSAAIANTGNAARQASAHVQAYRNSLALARQASWEKTMAARASANAEQRAANQAWAASKAHDALANSSRRASVALREQAKASQNAGNSVQNMNAKMNDAVNNMQATPGNIAAQFQDIGVTAAMGMNPLLIALQQGTQLSAAFAGGGLKQLGAAMRQVLSVTSLLTIGVVALVAILVQMAMEFFTAEKEASKLAKAIDNVSLTTSAFSNVQSALGNVIDLTTGKVNTQSDALRGLARAQLEVIRVQALSDQAESRRAMNEASRGARSFSALSALTVGAMPDRAGEQFGQRLHPSEAIMAAVQAGKVASDAAIDQLDDLRKAGKLTEEQFIEMIGAVSNFGMAAYNLEQYEQGRSALDGNQAALAPYLNLPKPRSQRGKTDADRFQDILETAQNDIATQRTREQVALLGDNIRAVAELEQRTKLLNDANRRGLTLTADMRDQIEGLVQEYADLAEAAAIAEAKTNMGDNYDDQVRGLAQARQLIGLYGQDLARATYEQQMLNAAEDAGIKVTGDLTDAQREYVETLKQRAAILAQMDEINRQRQSLENIRKEADEVAYALGLERDGLHLVNAEALAYNYSMDKLIEAKRQGIALSDAEVSAIQEAAEAYGKQRYEIDRAREAIEKSREITKGFFTDWVNKVREGGNIFKTFADSVINSLNRIIDKLMDNMWQNAFAGQSGGGFLGFLGGILGGAASGGSPVNLLAGTPYAKGGAFANDNEVMRFAKGGAFTNSIVSRPTLFQYANGGAFGEMGEAGPEAIMPLSRGPDGKLGVEARGARGGNNNVKVENTYNIGGVMTPEAIIAAIRQGGEETMRAVQRQLPTIMNEYERNGAVAA